MTKKTYLGISVIGVAIFVVLWFSVAWHTPLSSEENNTLASVGAIVPSPFHYAFSVNSKVKEVGSMEESTSPYWWVNSGAYMYLKDGVGMTIQGSLPENDPRRISYASYDPSATDGGFHPQNIFRLITRSKWQNFSQEAYFKITNYNLSASTHRAGDNGLLLFSHYVDQYNLYYAGIRVDGTVVIKKKKDQTYYIIANKPFIAGAKYDRETNPNLLPINQWIGVKSEIRNNNNGTVNIKLYIDKNNSKRWTLALDVTDDGKSYGGTAITDEAYAGIRTDFMDVLFDDYRIIKF